MTVACAMNDRSSNWSLDIQAQGAFGIAYDPIVSIVCSVVWYY